MKSLTKQEEFIIKAKKIHTDKYDYSKVNYKNAKEKIIIICKDHGSFLQSPECHLNCKGCKKCSNELKSINNAKHKFKFIEEANIKHHNKYDYYKVEYKNSKTKIIIICKNHGEFLQTPNSHLNNVGCPKCGGTYKLNNEYIDNYLINNYQIKRKNNSNYINAKTKIEWCCLNNNCNNEWKTTFNSIKNNNTGCPECFPKSKNEKLTKNIFKKLNINIKPFKLKLSHNIRYTTPDFWLPDYNLIIEINGEQHYKPICFNKNKLNNENEKFKKQQIRDQNLRDYCKNNNINLEEIDSREFYGEKLIKYLKEILFKYQIIK